MSNELAVRQTMSIDEMARVAKAMAQSGYFQDAKDISQAMVKILAGSEMGLGPFAAMTGLHIIKGKPVLGANLIATLIKNDPRYDYQVGQLDDKGCAITFYEGGQAVGESSFTADDAKQAGLSGDNWRKFPRNMYFARAISNGSKWYTPGIYGGAVAYTPDEFGLDVNEDGDILEAEYTDVTPHPEPPTNGSQPTGKPAPGANNLEDVLAHYGEQDAVSLPTIAQSILDLGYADHIKHANNIVKLHPVVKAIEKPTRATKVTGEQAAAIISWASERKDEPVEETPND